MPAVAPAVVPEVPAVVPEVPVVDPADPAMPLDPDGDPLPTCAFVSIQPSALDGLASLEPDVPVVPVVLDDALAGCRHPVTVIVLSRELDGDWLLVELVCAYAATAHPTTSANDAPKS